jgi:hypothetical protein
LSLYRRESAGSRQWQWYDITSLKWLNYSPQQNKQINDAYNAGESEFQLMVSRHRYTINFKCMSQINDESSNHRPIIMALRSIEIRQKTKLRNHKLISHHRRRLCHRKISSSNHHLLHIRARVDSHDKFLKCTGRTTGHREYKVFCETFMQLMPSHYYYRSSSFRSPSTSPWLWIGRGTSSITDSHSATLAIPNHCKYGDTRRTLCFHAPTRKWIFKSLLSIIMRCNEESMEQYLELPATSTGTTSKNKTRQNKILHLGDEQMCSLRNTEREEIFRSQFTRRRR